MPQLQTKPSLVKENPIAEPEHPSIWMTGLFSGDLIETLKNIVCTTKHRL